MSQKTENLFYCKKCDYTSRNKYDFKKHLSTAKHKKTRMVKNDNKNALKCVKTSHDNFVCKFCDYKTAKRSNYMRHISTLKHKNCEKRAIFFGVKNPREVWFCSNLSREKLGDEFILSLGRTCARQSAFENNQISLALGVAWRKIKSVA